VLWPWSYSAMALQGLWNTHKCSTTATYSVRPGLISGPRKGVSSEVFSCGIHHLTPAKSTVAPEKLQRHFFPDPLHLALHKLFYRSKNHKQLWEHQQKTQKSTSLKRTIFLHLTESTLTDDVTPALFSSFGFAAGHLPTALTHCRQQNCGRHSTTHF